jgi:hypothetical protein
MAQLPVHKYQIYCTSENNWSVGYGTQEPTTCYNDTAHTINPNSVQDLGLIGPNAVISSDASPDDAFFQLSTIEIDIPPNPTASQVIITNVSYPFDMYIWQMSISQIPANIGDQLTLAVSPDTVIGYVTAAATAGTNVINVSETVLANIVRGSDIGFTFTDGSGTIKEYPGRVIDIDMINGTVTMENNLTNSYPGIDGMVPQSYVLLTLNVIRNITFDSAERLVIGAKGLKPKLIPRNTPVSLIYTDNTLSNDSLKLYFLLEYYFK